MSNKTVLFISYNIAILVVIIFVLGYAVFFCFFYYSKYDIENTPNIRKTFEIKFKKKSPIKFKLAIL